MEAAPCAPQRDPPPRLEVNEREQILTALDDPPEGAARLGGRPLASAENAVRGLAHRAHRDALCGSGDSLRAIGHGQRLDRRDLQTV